MSYNAYLTVTLGGRGVGKTFGFKEYAVHKPQQTIWVRRYDADIDDICGTNTNPEKYLPDLYQEGKICAEDGYEMKGRTLYQGDLPRVHFIALNTSARKKSASYAGVDTIIFDEFLEKDPSKYLKGEVDKFYELVETVGRLRLKEFGKKDIRIFMLANKVSFINPYFADWGITPFTDRFRWFKEKTILVENYRNTEFERYKEKSNFGKLVKGTRYADYAIYNQSWENDEAYIAKRPEEAVFQANIRYKDRNIGLWTYKGRMYCSTKTNTNRLSFADTYDCNDKELPLRRAKPPLSWLNNYYDVGALRFDNNIVKQDIFTIMQTGGMTR